MIAKETETGNLGNAQLFCDGASSGNPGESGIGVLIRFSANSVQDHRISEYIGVATNNVAEYSALIRGLEEARSLGVRNITVFLDSELVVRQINGHYRVRNGNLKAFWSRAMHILRDFDSYIITHVGRERNREADTLARNAVKRARTE